ncbi:HAMP domain-containing sensor histidine kinase [Chelativorans sp.]|uniref:sensor histidine kinase n=1 Tax=Chelativorans sp. TaxID=2203393 RepID=UPI0028123625|nr:HAMP domain-containing sensor histidine kinase [Chelativorans sp.]
MAEEPHRDGGGRQAGAACTASLTRGLSTKILLLTILFVMAAEVLIFIPSVANFGREWMEQRLREASIVGRVLLEGDPDSLSQEATRDVLATAGVSAIVIRDGDASRLVVPGVPPAVDLHADLDTMGPLTAIRQAFGTLFFGGDRILRIFGHVEDRPIQYEVILPDRKLRSAMLVYARNVALLSLLISLITATLVFYAINRIMIRPIRAMTRSMLSFGAAPDNAEHIIEPEDRDDEIGVAERELAEMQKTLHRTLGERKRLAELGLAVSKINHDMRNMLSSAQLISDRLAMSADPTVQSLAPKLVRTLDRAVTYSQGVIAYGRAHEAPPARRRLRLAQLVEEVQSALAIDPMSGIEFLNQVEPLLEIDADAEQMFRVLSNLCRNSVQAMTNEADAVLVRRIIVSARREEGTVSILVADTGPGLPPKARENLFTAFRGSARIGGTGLGLAIAQELVRAHGGEIRLVETGSGRTVFSITLPHIAGQESRTGAASGKPTGFGEGEQREAAQ